MRVLVCGGRNFRDRAWLDMMLDYAHRLLNITGVVNGAARGADSLAIVWARTHNVLTLSYPASWKAYGPRAGVIRNQIMLDDGKPSLVIAFPGGPGTMDMVRRAQKAGVPVWQPIPPHAPSSG